ncbi:MAG: HAD family phosphatase [Magnetococcales bacterium]|nr:HAD family phosphatase [Magnetococcales bacterium]
MSCQKGLFLDLDGTLADSLDVMYRVYCDVLDEYQCQGSVEEFDMLNGPPLSVVAQRLIEIHHLTISEQDLLTRYWQLIFRQYEHVQPNPGAVTLLKSVHKQGYKIGVVSSSSKHLIQSWLHTHNLLNWIDCTVGGDSVSPGKPNPAPYLHALKITGCDAVLSWAVEDSRSGAQSALSAGLQTAILAADPAQLWPDGVCFITQLDDLLKVLS